MRIDKSLNRQGLLPQQLFFIECWSSLSSRNNIDSDRVTYNNPLNGINELLELYTLGEKYRASAKRRHIMTELLEMFDNDPVLKSEVFEDIPEQISSLFKSNESGIIDFKALEDRRKLIISFLTQLRSLVERQYINVSIEKLRLLLIANEQFGETVYDKIYQVTNMLLSSLLNTGMPLSECYLLYKHYLMKRRTLAAGGLQQDINFEDSFNLFVEKINNEKEQVRVSLKLISQRLYSLIESSANTVKFQNCEFVLIEHPNRNTVAVNIVVEAASYSSARAIADTDLNNALDIIAYMMNRADIQIERKYSACSFGAEGQPIDIKHLNDLTQPIVNGSDRLSFSEFNLFISTVSHLQDIADKKTIHKVNSAFRFYQNGVTDSTQESRFTAYWSALESLTLGVHDESLGHDEHVILSVLPCIGLDYPVKQLFALRGVSKELRWQPFTFGQSDIDFKTANLGEIYEAIKDQNLVNDLYIRLNDYPYAKYRFEKFILQCACPYKLGIKIQKHQSKVELQIHRLYRVRNAIVHNASAQDRLDMLVVNLEHYLRGTLNAMVYMMKAASSISSPEEAFNRYQHLANEILTELDPSYPLSAKKREGMRSQIANGSRQLNDTKLVKWLVMHS
ncbi:hypothetical protein H5201_15775 [Pseudoalteromonas sp. SG43-6]|uniref:hypothetical protein n=1 Tax=Pseudoalteromonas sp. SG43-6 TaxID=2760967 RepID=UPI0016023FFF|nr:hypothetical protein [Pseudoalteromonas sp. SG43-6]MBB1435727.1 hypothetical protein [Pseudoalteromonas sp. SG43-6]